MWRWPSRPSPRVTLPRRTMRLAAGWHHISVQPAVAAIFSAYVAQAALARGDLTAARRWADDAVAATTGWHLSVALTTRARVAIAQGEPEQAERDAHEALATAASTRAYTGAPDTLECLAALAVDAGSHREAARLFGAADAIRQRIGEVRFKIYDAGYETSVAALRDAMGDEELDTRVGRGRRAVHRRSDRLRPAPPGRTETPDERLGLAHAHRARRRTTGQRRARQQGHRAQAFRLTAHRANPPHPRLHQTRPDLACATRPGSSPARLTVGDSPGWPRRIPENPDPRW